MSATAITTTPSMPLGASSHWGLRSGADARKATTNDGLVDVDGLVNVNSQAVPSPRAWSPRASVTRQATAIERSPTQQGDRGGALLALLAKVTLPTSWFENVGARVSHTAAQVLSFLGFMGMVVERLAKSLSRPKEWRLTSLVAQIDQTGLQAVPVVTVTSFLVGAVVAFLGASILETFGASLYVIQLVGYAFLREFGPMLAAILVAGRTSSAFAAQIGSMRANEEVDAMRVMGLFPIDMLVLPRVLALLVSLPALTFLAMLAGLLGGATVCAATLQISWAQFVSVLSSEIGVRHFFIGMCKAPLFAFFVALIGCAEGFKANASAQSVGERTTSAVVTAIFSVIVIDALAALLFTQIGW